MNIVLLGSTGSIGTSTLEVVEAAQNQNQSAWSDAGRSLSIIALSTHRNVVKLAEQARRFQVKYVAITDPEAAKTFNRTLFSPDVHVLTGPNALLDLARLPEADTVVSAVVGRAGLESTLAAIEASKRVALANKESLVIGGELVINAVKRYNTALLPIDSEHGAVFQSMLAGKKSEIQRIILTASGGPFRLLPDEELENVTLDQALQHPTWKMGRKITIDSATLMNKALEIIEARWLFDLTADQIQVVIHPQSYVHSMVEYVDGSIIGQISPPDMRLPIQYALSYPYRVPGVTTAMDWLSEHKLEFFPPKLDRKRFMALSLAFDVVKYGGTAACAMNAANEIAVQGFIDGKISFGSVVPLCKAAVAFHLDNHFVEHPNLDELIDVDLRTRNWANDTINS